MPNPSPGPQAVRYEQLNLLRGGAALWVMAFHFLLGAAWLDQSYPLLRGLVDRAAFATTLFVVLSGFCLMASIRSAARRAESAAAFLYHRLKRLLPPYWCSVAVTAAYPFVVAYLGSLLTGVYVPPQRPFVDYGWLDWLRIVTLTQVFCSGGAELTTAFGGLNGVYWTLALIVQFYVVLAVAWAGGGKRFWPVILSVTAISCVVALDPAAYGTGVFLPYWPLFAAGLGLYVLLERGGTPDRVLGRRAPRVCAVLLALAGAGLGAGLAYDLLPYSRHGYALCIVGLLWLGYGVDKQVTALVRSRRTLLVLPLRALAFVGVISYSVYLFHPVLINLVLRLLLAVPGLWRVSESLGFVILALGLIVMLCYPVYRVCEQPFLRKKTADVPAPPPGRPEFSSRLDGLVRPAGWRRRLVPVVGGVHGEREEARGR